MKLFKQAFRLLLILSIILKYTLSKKPYPIRIRKAFEDLGPIFIKFGQLLSTRADLLSEELSLELSKLQDQVPAFCGKKAQKIIEESLGKPIDQLYAEFDPTPLASASIAQVHAATMFDGQQVVVKVLRPNIHRLVQQDIELLLTAAKLISVLWPKSRRFKPYAMAEEIKKSIYAELDLVREAANASQLRRNFANSQLLYVPAVYWSHTRENVLTLERIYGTQVSNIKQLVANDTDLKLLAERGVEIFFTQVFRDCFFHADMHPGNVWVSIDNPRNPKYLALDFGIIGSLTPADQYYVAENLLAFFKRDYRKVALLHIECGWIPKHVRVDEFEAAIRAVSEPIFERPLKEISFGQTLLRLLQTAHKFDMQIQPQLLLLQKTLLSVEGLGRQLYPDLDLWSTAMPFLEEWAIERLKAKPKTWLEKLPELPAMIYKALQNVQAVRNANINTAIRPSVWYYFTLGAVSACLLTILSMRYFK